MSSEMPIRAGPESVMMSPRSLDAIAHGETCSAMQGVVPAMVTLADIEAARRTIAGHVLRTPLLPSPPLSALTGAEIFVKYENLQVTNSFKERGACVKLAALSAEQRRRGVIAMSAGDHRHAGDDAVRENQSHRGARRHGRARRRDACGGPDARRGDCRRARSGL